MPNPPPGCDHRHAAQAVKKVENNDQAKPRVLNTGFQGNGPGIEFWQPVENRPTVTGQQCQRVVSEYQQKDNVKIINDVLVVPDRSKDDESREK